MDIQILDNYKLSVHYYIKNQSQFLLIYYKLHSFLKRKQEWVLFLNKKSHYLQRTLQKIQQGELFNYMTERELKGFQSGKYGSTALHLTSLQYQIKQDCPDLFIGVDLAIIHK